MTQTKVVSKVMTRSHAPSAFSVFGWALAAFFAALPVLAQQAWSPGVNYEYDYDGSGNIIRIGSDPHRYDLVGRLVESTTHGVRTNFTYDAFGNRTTCVRAESDCQYGYTIDPGTNRMAGVNHDRAGNVVAFEGRTFTYDAVNVPTGELVSSALVTEYVYSADDERVGIATPVNGKWRWTVRDASNKVLREFTSVDPASGPRGSSSWKWAKDYVWRDGLLLATREKEPASSSVSTYRYHLDHLGTPRLITNDEGTVVGRHDYHAFGAETSTSIHEPSPTAMKYTGHERDGELDYMHARYYSAKAGRFLSVDPGGFDLGRPQAWNRYSYVTNNPLSRIDPDGRAETEVVVGIRSVAKFLDEAPTSPANSLARDYVTNALTDLADWADATDDLTNHAFGNNTLDAAQLRSVAIKHTVAGTKLALNALPAGRGGSASVRAGQIGEDLAGIARSQKSRILIPGTLRVRIPDELRTAAGVLREVKNVLYQARTMQLRDFLAYAQEKGFRFVLVVRKNTLLSRPLQKLVDDGYIELQRTLP